MLKIIRIFIKFLKIFFGADSAEEIKKRGIVLSLAVPAFRWFDWLLVGLTQILVAFLIQLGLSYGLIFLLLWTGNIALNWSIVAINDKTKIDFTLMEGLRRLINAALEKSRLTGRILEAIILIRLIIWDGSDNVVIFFRHKLDNFYLRLATFIVVSGVQMGVWTTLYVLGYHSFSQLFKKFFL